MINKRFLFLFPILFTLLFSPAADAQQRSTPNNSSVDLKALVQKLPDIGKANGATDWLLDPKGFKATVGRNGDRLVLSNGLLSRQFLVQPEVATVSFTNRTGQEILRAVRPEAFFKIDGKNLPVGGLIGQPNQAFLADSWIKDLKVDPNSLQCVGFEIGQPKAPFQWKRVRHHAKKSQWPPSGVSLRFDYRQRENFESARNEDFSLPSDQGRKQLYSSDMLKLDGSWKIHRSPSHPRSSIQNEGKVGEIYTPANSAAFAQMPLPKDARLIEVGFNHGTDKSATWGPGMALVFENKQVLKVNLRPGKTDSSGLWWFGCFNGESENAHFGSIKAGNNSKWKLRARVSEKELFFDAKGEKTEWKLLAKMPLSKQMGRPVAVRFGKLGRTGGEGDYTEPGDLVRLKYESLAVYGPIDFSMISDSEKKKRFTVSVHYELYDGVPVLCKWLSLKNESRVSRTVDRFKSEVLALVEYDNPVEFRKEVGVERPKWLHVETDFAFGGFNHENANRHVVHYRPDRTYTTQVNYPKQSPCLLEVEPTYGPSQEVEPGQTFKTFRTYQLVYDSFERERRSLSLRKMYRTIAPWVTENPLMHHLLSSNPKRAMQAIDEAASVGFEMIILSFGSGFNMENDNPAYLAKWKEVADYAKKKGIEIGSYSLLSSRRIGGGNDIVPPKGSRATHGVCPALTSKWGLAYYKKLYQFFDKTGFDLLEHDGPYPGDVDTTARPPYQKGVQDSRWVQWKIASNFYRFCRENGIYVNAPDYYFLNGTNKCGMGYREVNWSLPRAHQVIHTRQNIFDGSWKKTPSMGWMFVPLSQYHGGGKAATIEPLHQHQDHYRRMMQSNLALGVQACYRGPRLFDTKEVQELVKEQVDWFKKYREVLEADLIHGRRADGRGLDWMLHANPSGQHKGMLVVFNPTESARTETLRVPLYYTGIEKVAKLTTDGKQVSTKELSRDYFIDCNVTVPAGGMTWVLLESEDSK